MKTGSNHLAETFIYDFDAKSINKTVILYKKLHISHEKQARISHKTPLRPHIFGTATKFMHFIILGIERPKPADISL